MKRIKVITAIITLITMFIVMPFSVVKADTVTTAQNGTFDEGIWQVNAIISDNANDYLDLSPYGWTNMERYYRSGVIINVGFDNVYSGSITVNFTSDISSYALYDVQGEGVGAYRLVTSDNYMEITLTGCSQLKIYMFSSAYNLSPAAQVSSIDSDLTVAGISEDIYQLYLNQKYNPFYNIAAYVWGLGYGDYEKMTPFEFPCINYLKANNNATYDLSHRITKPIGKDVVIYYLTTTYTLNSNIEIYTWSGNTLNKLNTQLMNYNVIDGTYLYLNKLTISGDNTFQDFFEVEFKLNFRICPLYIGDPDNIPDDLALIAGEDYSNTYTNLLEEIRDAIIGSSDSTVDEDITTQADTLTDLHDQESQVSDSVNSNFNDFQNNVDLNDYNFIDNISDASSYFKMVLTDVFSETAPVRAFWIVPVLCVVLLALLGG